MRIRSGGWSMDVGVAVVARVAVTVAVAVGAFGTACGGGGSHKQAAPTTVVVTTAAPTTTTTEAMTVAGLRAAAQVILAAYAAGDWGTFWDHWDATSQALIIRDEYVRRKTACPGIVGQPISVSSTVPAANGIWNVRGRRGTSVTTYQFRYGQGAWSYVVTDPTVKAELKESYDAYVARPGCTKA